MRENDDFLCEQVYDVDSALDDDSVLSADMSIEERRGKYGEVMDGRIEEAGNDVVREVLTSLRDWVLSYDERR